MQKSDSPISPDPQHCLRVCHIASGDLWGGAEAQLFTLAKTQHQSGDISVSLVLMNDGELAQRLREAGIDVLCLDESSSNPLQLVQQIRRFLKTKQADILHSHRQKENVLGSIANLLSANAKSVRTQHGAAEYNLSFAQQLADNADYFVGRYLQKQVIAVSVDLRNKLLQRFPANHISTIVNGLDIEQVQQNASENPDPLGTHRKHQNVGIVGRLEPVKRVDIFLEIAQRLASEHCAFHIFGDGALAEEIGSQASQLNQALGFEAVTLHGHRTDIASCIAALDCLVMCSDHEGLPMTLLEACALKVPTVAHKVGGIPELISNDQGVLVEEHSGEGYASAVDYVLNNTNNYSDMPFPKGFSATDNERAIAQLYHRVLNNKH